MFSWIDTIWDKLFPLPTPIELAMTELQNAHRELLVAQSAQEHATAMVQYNQDRVARLSSMIKGA